MSAIKAGKKHPTISRLTREISMFKMEDEMEARELQRRQYSSLCCTCQRGPPGPTGEPGLDGKIDIPHKLICQKN